MKALLLSILSILIMGSEAIAASKSANLNTREKPLVDVDIGGSAGTYNGRSFSEINLGVNLNFTDWLTWRNAAFKRFSSQGDKDISGLDSTLRFINTSRFDSSAVRVFAGAGYRFADPSEKNALLGEAGLALTVGRFGIGGGAKYLKYDKLQIDLAGNETKRDDLIYFITLSGGTGFSF